MGQGQTWWAWLSARGRTQAANVLRKGPVPVHVAFIMDGNRRCAEAMGSDHAAGHRLGFDRVPTRC